jgi:hypothetical protein
MALVLELTVLQMVAVGQGRNIAFCTFEQLFQ